MDYLFCPTVALDFCIAVSKAVESLAPPHPQSVPLLRDWIMRGLHWQEGLTHEEFLAGALFGGTGGWRQKATEEIP